MKKRIALILLSIFTAVSFYSVDANAWLYVQALNPQNPAIQAQIDAAINQAYQDIYSQTILYQRQPRLAKGFANASAYSSNVATQRGYQGYDLFALTVGAMIGGQAPSRSLSYYNNIDEKLQYRGDLYAGAAFVPWTAQIGLNCGIFGVEDLYMAVKFGKNKFHYSGYAIDFMNIGLQVNYQFMDQRKAPIGIFLWRGFSLGSGLYYQYNKMDMQQNLYNVTENVGAAIVVVRPKFQFKIHTSSYVVPLELTTAVRILWILNFSLGGGADFAMAESAIKIRGYSPIIVFPAAFPGAAFARGEQKGKHCNPVMPKLIGGVGVNLGPVIVDVPMTYYFVNGFNLGLSVGFVW
ncbi:MAG: hypothetical protein MUD12_01375 [Spirochaetes bacterium]|jgi:hypothetical protein|nr:hypothetical protein [Spirochaetota bacterium]